MAIVTVEKNKMENKRQPNFTY